MIPAVLTAASLHAQTPDSITSRVVVDGVIHRRITRASGPWIVNVVEVDLRRPALSIEGEHALGALRGREATSSIARRTSSPHAEVIVAINADFFDLKTGENENNQIVRGQFLKALSATDSPYDAFDNVHSQLAITGTRTPLLERFTFAGAWLSRWGAVSVSALNFVPHKDALVLFSDAYGDSTRRDTAGAGVSEVMLALAARHGDTLVYRLASGVRDGGGSLIPPRGAVLAGYGGSRGTIRAVSASKRSVKIVLDVSPHRGRIRTLLGGWPCIVRDGRNIAAGADSAEGTFARFAAGRHPRTGVGFSRDSATLFLVTVDGRLASSIGMSLVELADQLVSLGVYQGLNFDGGGSTTLVIRGQVVNTSSDSAGERRVGNALLVMRRR